MSFFPAVLIVFSPLFSILSLCGYYIIRRGPISILLRSYFITFSFPFLYPPFIVSPFSAPSLCFMAIFLCYYFVGIIFYRFFPSPPPCHILLLLLISRYFQPCILITSVFFFPSPSLDRRFSILSLCVRDIFSSPFFSYLLVTFHHDSFMYRLFHPLPFIIVHFILISLCFTVIFLYYYHAGRLSSPYPFPCAAGNVLSPIMHHSAASDSSLLFVPNFRGDLTFSGDLNILLSTVPQPVCSPFSLRYVLFLLFCGCYAAAVAATTAAAL